ncbi:hypothetical protein SEA_PRAIRIE_59 [Arthrobacter phage Prairie]|uniref:Uncharacterized protein n=1 Tax=Arthrobacter phage Prairie TaxID=2816463 RepID=A0A8A5LQA4_9CAUD|nr:hypothetical protein SEA_PRAIRIE_59 [Arthrobacter phage Prairie]
MTRTAPEYVAALAPAGLFGERDAEVHKTLRELHRSLAPDLQDRIAVESYYDPAADGWRLVMHRIPYVPPAPATPEEEDARRAAVLEEALADPKGLALAKAIIERKELHEALADFKPGGTSADDEPDEFCNCVGDACGGHDHRCPLRRELPAPAVGEIPLAERYL